MVGAYEWYRRGLALLASGRPREAADALERAVMEEPAKGSLRELLGRAHYKAGRFARALEEFRRALEIEPVNDAAHVGAGLCLDRIGRIEEALGHLRLAVAMRPGASEYARALAAVQRRNDLRFS